MVDGRGGFLVDVWVGLGSYSGGLMKLKCMQAINKYLREIDVQYQSGRATEHSYRPALGELLDELLGGKRTGISITNEPARLECGAPDFVLTCHNIPFGYIETKNVAERLDDKKHQEQFKRYRDALGQSHPD